jgi:outer membrane receptor for ferrienterochelin and colicin
MNKIYCFSNIVGGGDGMAYAMAEDGIILGSHWCSNEWYVPKDLGVLEGYRLDRHEKYKQHYPNGYEMEFVKSKDISAHEGLQKAFKLNQEQAELTEE